MSSLSDAAVIVTGATAVIALAGSYVQFVLKRTVLPSAEFDVEFMPYVRGSVQLVGEVALVLMNVGPTTLIVTDVRCRIVYRLKNDVEERAGEDPAEPCFAHKMTPFIPAMAVSQMPSSPAVSSMPEMPSSPSIPSVPVASGQSWDTVGTYPGWLTMVRSRTFIQPGVTQYYRKPIVLPVNTQLIHIWGAFDYPLKFGPVSSFLTRKLGPPQNNQNELNWQKGISNHTIRRTFVVSDTLSSPPESG